MQLMNSFHNQVLLSFDIKDIILGSLKNSFNLNLNGFG